MLHIFVLNFIRSHEDLDTRSVSESEYPLISLMTRKSQKLQSKIFNQSNHQYHHTLLLITKKKIQQG